MNGLIKRMNIMNWFKELPYAKTITLTWKNEGPKRIWGRAFPAKMRIILFPCIFDMTFESVQYCLLHEIAHILQYVASGYTKHDNEFDMIHKTLLNEHGTDEIRAAKRSGSIATAAYKYDYAC